MQARRDKQELLMTDAHQIKSVACVMRSKDTCMQARRDKQELLMTDAHQIKSVACVMRSKDTCMQARRRHIPSDTAAEKQNVIALARSD